MARGYTCSAPLARHAHGRAYIPIQQILDGGGVYRVGIRFLLGLPGEVHRVYCRPDLQEIRAIRCLLLPNVDIRCIPDRSR